MIPPWNRYNSAVGSNLQKTESNCPTTSEFIKSYGILPRAISECLLNTDRHGSLTTSLGNLFPYLTTSNDVFFLMSNLIFPNVLLCSSHSAISDEEQDLEGPSSSLPQGAAGWWGHVSTFFRLDNPKTSAKGQTICLIPDLLPSSLTSFLYQEAWICPRLELCSWCLFPSYSTL